jgi:hypothetical protein
MAKVTGFTADRMLVIENETVVDGEVQGDNLILTTREGTPIDAGNVRGPQGIPGTPGAPGAPGAVPSVNDQTGAVYAPRIFTNKAELDSQWGNAPAGAQAFTTSELCSWIRVGGAWVLNAPRRIFATKAELDAQWTTAPNGANAYTTSDNAAWVRIGGVWQPTVVGGLARRGALFSVPAGETIVPMDNLIIGRGGVALVNGELTVPVTGLYSLVASLPTMNGPSNGGLYGTITLSLYNNQVPMHRTSLFINNWYAAMQCVGMYEMNAGNAVKMALASAAQPAWADPVSGLGGYLSIGLQLVSL